MARRPAERVGRAGAPAAHQVDRGQRAVDRRPRRLPGARADQRHRVVAELARPGRASRPPGSAACPGSSRASGRRRARPGPGRPARRTDPRPTRRGCVRRWSTNAGSWTRAAPSSSWRRRLDAARGRPARRGSGRPARGTSVPSVGTPTQTSRIGSWRRVSGDHTTGIGMAEHRQDRWSRQPPRRLPRRGLVGWAMPRARDLGIVIGVPARPARPTPCSTSPASGSGHATVHPRRAGPAGGPRRRPHRRHAAWCSPRTPSPGRCPAGGAVLNGAGECTGFITAAEWGSAETPVYLTSTLQLGPGLRLGLPDRARGEPRRARPTSSSRWSRECDDSFLNDARRMQVEHEDVVAAWDAALASRGSVDAARRGRRRVRHRDVVPRLQGRHRDGVPGRRRATPSRSC